jgi:hypothetical protein
MPSDSAPLLRDLTVALLKVVGVVIALAFIYPFVVTAIGHSLK